MTNYWAMRTDREKREFIFQELKQGRLRQGWGYKDEQNLNVIVEDIKKNNELNDDQRVSWRGNRKMHHDQEDGIKKGDLIFLPNLPTDRNWLVAEVTGSYEFNRDNDEKDYGHILPVKVLNSDSPINPNNKYVSANLRRSFTCRSRLWSLNPYRSDLQTLVKAVDAGENVSTPEELREKLSKVHSQAMKSVEKTLTEKFGGANFEKPVQKLLEQVYGNDVKHTAGPTERGADFVCKFTDGLGIQHTIIIQVKAWKGIAGSVEPLKQLEQRIEGEETVSAGVVLSIVDQYSEEFNQELDKLKKKTQVNIIAMTKQDVCNLFMKYLPDIVSQT